MNSLAIDLFGVANVRLDGSQIRFRRRHSIALLSYLVLTGRSHARDEVASLLGGELSEEAARKLMRNVLGDLRQCGLGEVIRADRNAVSFVDGSAVVDVHRLELVHAAGDRADISDLVWAVNFSGIELLSGLSLGDGPDFEDWLRQERQYRSRQVQEIASRLLNRYEAEHRLDEGISLARKLISVERWNEGLHRRLMRLLAMDNQIQAAIDQFQTCLRLLDEELGAEPQPATLELFEQLMAGPSALRNNVLGSGRAVPDPVVGRSDPVDSIIKNLFLPDCRLVSVTGLRGSGRSTIVRAVASRLVLPQMFTDRHRFADGVFISDLRESSSRGQEAEQNNLVTTIGIDLGLVFYGNVDPLEHLLSYLASKRLLLILDNFEAARRDSSIVSTILSRAPHVTILLTAREPLGLAGEWTEVADGLSLPVSAHDLLHSEAGTVLIREATRLQARTRDSDRPFLVQMCKLVGGHPVALGVLAAWLRVLPAREIVWQLTNSGHVLTEPVLGFNDLKMSLKDIADSELEPMGAATQNALSRLSVFDGGFDIGAVRAVGVALDEVQELLNRGTLEFCDDTYVVHPLIRLFGLARLDADTEVGREVRSYQVCSVT